ncbi:DUF3331 domain-containing protein [Paraburkholderia silviterrae]|uniref:DUF3331 domain-containing protein n=1 Tax=Paraburkholderia silviterrae TaxID=2528715 RepID=A0A4R5LX65_9BURK|nr:DUF3331 domain-containing protein [Paraburkholderia silviterrae]
MLDHSGLNAFRRGCRPQSRLKRHGQKSHLNARSAIVATQSVRRRHCVAGSCADAESHFWKTRDDFVQSCRRRLAHTDTGASDPPEDTMQRETNVVWTHTLSTLARASCLAGGEDAVRPDAPGERAHWQARACSDDLSALPTIVILEWLDNAAISLSWHDATSCNYEEQTWTVSKARTRGRCALSGRLIERGDCVFRPRLRGAGQLRNGNRMILVDSVDAL